jgi:SAM-dependent methyltransferase
MSTNFGAAAEDYAKHRAGFPESFFDRLAALGFFEPGTTIVDVGTGTGTLARGFAKRGARVIAIDPDERLIRQARRIDGEFSPAINVEYKLGTAEQIPLADSQADVVSAGQCWHWFNEVQAAKEFARILKTDGHVVVAHFDWLPLPDNVVEATEQLIKEYNPSWRFDGGNGFHPESIPHLHSAGFRQFETFSYDLDVEYTPAAWRGRIRASAGIGASLNAERIHAFDAALARLLEESFDDEVLQVPHRVFAVVASGG